MRATQRPRSAAAIACAVLILGASLCIQLSAAIAKGLFATVGTVGVSGLRMGIAAVVLLVLIRPVLPGRSRRECAGIVLYGAAMAAMNVLFYNAVANVPLGIAVTLEFLGPFFVAFFGTRIRWESALIGALVLDQRLTAAVGVGIALVVVSGSAVTWLAGARRATGASIRPAGPGCPRTL